MILAAVTEKLLGNFLPIVSWSREAGLEGVRTGDSGVDTQHSAVPHSGLGWAAALPLVRPACCAFHGFVSVRGPSGRDVGPITAPHLTVTGSSPRQTLETQVVSLGAAGGPGSVIGGPPWRDAR